MSDMTEDRFLQAYGNMLVKIWGTPGLKKRFKDDPAMVCKEFGLDPEGAEVFVDSPMATPTDECTKESQVKMWNEGKKAGRIRLIFPEFPPEGAEEYELSDADLEAVAGGGDSCCCCCTPCCSCC